MSLKENLIRIKWFPANLINRIVFKTRKMQVGSKLQMYGTIFIRGTGRISLGDNTTITSCREANPIGGDTKTILYAKGSSIIIIGNNCGISNSALVAINSIIVEDDVMIGGSCKLYDHDFHSIYFEQRMRNPDTNVKSAPIKIKRGAFIGAGTIILKGVTVGARSVVGAGSVVTRNIPDGEVWAGNPAKYIKTLFGEK